MEKKIKGIKKAVGDYNRWDGQGRGPPRTGRDRVRADSSSVKERIDAAKATKAEASAEKAKIKAKQRDVLTEIQRQKGATHGIGFWRRRGRA